MQTGIEGPAFTTVVKALASALVASLAYFGLRSLSLMLEQRWSWTALLFMAGAAVFLVLCYWWMLCSRGLSSVHTRHPIISSAKTKRLHWAAPFRLA